MSWVGIRTHDSSVRTGEDFYVLDRAATVIGGMYYIDVQ
jgi:hypothetical protein